jgi:mono/diheme cytochrome c family protein
MLSLRTLPLSSGIAVLFLIACGIFPLAFGSATPTPTVLSRGEQLYNANCLVCHSGATGGFMMDYPPKHNANGHTWHHPDCELKQVILNGGDEMTAMMRQMMNVPDSVARMPAWKDKLSNEEIDAILAFIKTWWAQDQREFQARITKQQC